MLPVHQIKKGFGLRWVRLIRRVGGRCPSRVWIVLVAGGSYVGAFEIFLPMSQLDMPGGESVGFPEDDTVEDYVHGECTNDNCNNKRPDAALLRTDDLECRWRWGHVCIERGDAELDLRVRTNGQGAHGGRGRDARRGPAQRFQFYYPKFNVQPFL